jgi:hypothetical protein
MFKSSKKIHYITNIEMKIEKPSYVPVAEGVHLVEIYKVEECVNRYSGDPQCRVIFKLVDEEVSSCLISFFRPVLHPRANIMKLFDALDLEIPDDASEIDLEQYVERQLKVKVEHNQKPDGRVYADITEYIKVTTFNPGT